VSEFQKRNWRLGIATAVLLLGVVLGLRGVMSLVRTEPRFREVPPVTVPRSQAAAQNFEWNAAADDFSTIKAALQTSVQTKLAAVIPSERVPAARLSEEVAKSFDLYMRGSFEEFLGDLQSRRLDYPEDWGKGGMIESLWRNGTGTIRGTKLSTESIQVRQRFRRGEEVAVAPEPSVSKSSRPGRNPLAADPAAAQLDIYEVVIPMELTTMSGRKFNGRLGLWYAWLPARREWDLFTIAIYGEPANDAVIPPPL
jgi:hypothetical protein